jgi:hypothetical protein
MNDSLFKQSITNHQKLVDVLREAQNSTEVSEISYAEIAKRTEHSITWVKQAIKKLNTEDTCIEVVGYEQFVVHYTDLLSRGVFGEIAKLMVECYQNMDVFHEKDMTLSEKYNVSLKTVQMFKSYLRTGWKKETVS